MRSGGSSVNDIYFNKIKFLKLLPSCKSVNPLQRSYLKTTQLQEHKRTSLTMHFCHSAQSKENLMESICSQLRRENQAFMFYYT